MRPRSHILKSEIRSQFCESLQACAYGEEAIEWLLARNVRDQLIELAAENAMIMAELESSSKPTVAVLNDPELVHFAVCLRVPQTTMDALLRAVESVQVAKYFPHSGIWRDYVAALSRYHRGAKRVLPLPKTKGFEKFMLPYIRYMCAGTEEERRIAESAAVKCFAERNADRRYTDWLGLDGDGKKPVRWDFRLYAIKRAEPISAYGGGV